MNEKPSCYWCCHGLAITGKECLIPDGYQALISWDVRIQLYPLPSMAWKREVKTIVAHALHTRIFYLKTHYLGICQTETPIATFLIKAHGPLAKRAVGTGTCKGCNYGSVKSLRSLVALR